MASKIIIFALLALAHQSTAQSSQSAVSGDLVSCLSAYEAVNLKLDLDIDLAWILSSVLNIVVELLDNVFSLVGGLLRGVLGLVGGILGGGGRQPPKVPVPNDRGRMLGVVYVALYTVDRACAQQLGSSVYDRDYLSQIFIGVVVRIAANERWNISGQNYDWCQQDRGFNLQVYIQRVLAIRVRVTTGPLVALLARVEELLRVILANTGNLTASLLGTIVSYVYNILFGMARGCGWPGDTKAVAVVQVNISAVLQNNGCGRIDPNILNNGTYCFKCMS